MFYYAIHLTRQRSEGFRLRVDEGKKNQHDEIGTQS
jgi:hypothetical protein